MTSKVEYAQIEPYVTLDGSRVRELMHPRVHGNRAQSLAEAIVDVGGRPACTGTLRRRSFIISLPARA